MKNKKTNIIEWGDNHKKYIKDYKKAQLFAYEKAFYFEVKLNGEKFERKF